MYLNRLNEQHFNMILVLVFCNQRILVFIMNAKGNDLKPNLLVFRISLIRLACDCVLGR